MLAGKNSILSSESGRGLPQSKTAGASVSAETKSSEQSRATLPDGQMIMLNVAGSSRQMK
jgi:hypothetical protein